MSSLRCRAVGRGRPEVMVWLVVWTFRWNVRLIDRIWGAGRFLLLILMWYVVGAVVFFAGGVEAGSCNFVAAVWAFGDQGVAF